MDQCRQHQISLICMETPHWQAVPTLKKRGNQAYRFHHQSSSKLAKFKGSQSVHRRNIILPTERSTFWCCQDNGMVVQRVFHTIPQTPCTHFSTFPPKPTGHLEQSVAVHSPTHEISCLSMVSLHFYYLGFQAHCEALLTPTLYGITAHSSRQVQVQFWAGKTFGFLPMSQSSSHPCTQHHFYTLCYQSY